MPQPETITLPEAPAPEEPAGQALTPMMSQYHEIKAKYPGYMLFYRMGDFFELFHDDAVIASKALDIILTRRGKSNGTDILMCGVPIHAYESYLAKLIRLGHKVAICEQVESPEEARRLRGYKAVVKREVVRVVTPGTLTEDNLLDAAQSNYLLSLSCARDNAAMAWCDISTGELYFSAVRKDNLLSEIERISPKEIIISDEILNDREYSDFLDSYRRILSAHSKAFFDPGKAERRIKNTYNITTLESFGTIEKVELGCIGALLEYIEITQVGRMPRLSVPRRNAEKTFLEIDSASFRNLEIFRSSSGETGHSLYGLLNQTCTNAGARLLQKILARPLLKKYDIEKRLEAVEFFIRNPSALNDIRAALKAIPDFERIISRIFLKRSNPRDIAVLRDGLKITMRLSEIFSFATAVKIPSEIKQNIKNIFNFDSLIQLLDNALVEYPPINLNEGGYIKPSFNPKLDNYRNIRKGSEKIKAELQEKYIKHTGVNTLKIKDNNVIGMFIEVTAQHSDKMPSTFIHRQTLANNIRYTTEDLRKIENEIINASSYALNLEQEIYQKLCEEIILYQEKIITTAEAISHIDVFCNFAYLAVENNYSRPQITDSFELCVENGRHPIVECALRKISKEKFAPNDLHLKENEKIWLLTGPNMSGKSTFLRQNALIIIMAQIGCFIPADKAVIGVVDKIFSRVGASDNIAKGHSTFMVEMIETASILNNSSERSFVILDEIGRGTATFDGLAIAWATLEHLHDNLKCRSLFATHYHELNSLKTELKNLSCHTTQIREWNGDIIFMHKIVSGHANQSYGIHVAKLAGVPKNVISRANEILEILVRENKTNEVNIISSSLPLFNNNNEKPVSEHDEIARNIKALEVDKLTPIEALNLLVEYRKKLQP